MPVPVMSATKFEKFFRATAGLHVDGHDFSRYHAFVGGKLGDILIRGQAVARANGRDVVEPDDLPIATGLRELMCEFERLDRQLGLRVMLDNVTPRPWVDARLSAATDEELPRVVGALSIALGRCLEIVDPEVKSPGAEHWERAFRLFDLLL
jgi:hypothetical protein